MLTTDLSLKFDPSYREIAMRFQKDPKEFERAFAKAWFKLTHRDLGPRARYLGSEVPDEALIWQDPIPAVDHDLISKSDIRKLKASILKSGLSSAELIQTAWASAASFRATDMRGGANGARLRLAPQNQWAANNPESLTKVLEKLTAIQQKFNSGKAKVSMADLIVLGGAAAIEAAASEAGVDVTVPFTPGRMDASQEQTDVASFAVLEPSADGFRNYYSSAAAGSPTDMMIEKASLLNLSIPEMTALAGGLRVLGANSGDAQHGVFTYQPGVLSNDFFVNLLDMSTEWSKSADQEGVYIGSERATGKARWTATPVDLMFGSSAELRAVAEVYAENGAEQKFANDFVAAWAKVMNLDRF
jgi:catalase-peroxidase